MRAATLRVSLALAAAIAAVASSTAHATASGPIRFGTTAVILQDQSAFLARWGRYLGTRLGRAVQFVQRGSYAEIGELLSKGQLDVAWVCGAPYVRHRDSWKLVAVPVHRGKPMYRSYLIVRSSDRRTRSYADLDGAVFAYSDPDSNSGYLVPQFEMLEQGLRPADLFRKAFFTWAHQDTVRAVAVGLAEAGAVDGYIWEVLAQIQPELTARTRIVSKSDWYAFPPIAARGSIDVQDLQSIRRALIDMTTDREGRELLREMGLDGFVEGDDSMFDDIARINRLVDARYAARP